MRYDRGTLMIGRWNAKEGMEVWAPLCEQGRWEMGRILAVEKERGVAYVVCGGEDRWYSLWQLRVRDPYKDGRDKPDEPVPPTLGRPKAKANQVRLGILTNGDIKGP